MPNYESTAELDKALEDGSFEEVKPPKPEAVSPEVHPELNLTPQEQSELRSSTSLIEAAQQLDQLAVEAQEDGQAARMDAIQAKAAELRLKANEMKNIDEETRENIVARAQTDVENFAGAVKQAKEAQQDDRVEDAREDVEEVLTEAPSAIPMAPEKSATEVLQLQADSQEVETSPVFTMAKPTVEAFKDLSKDAKKKDKYVMKAAKTLAKSYQKKFKALEKQQKGRSLEDRLAARQDLARDAEEEWKKLKNMLETTQ